MKYGILGYGYVGKATHASLLRNNECLIHDHLLGTDLTILQDADYIFVCIPTSSNDDIEALINELKALKELNPKVKFIIRSTLPVNTSDRIELEINEKIIYIPEFLRERHWEVDCQKRPLVVGHSGIDLPDILKADEIVECSLVEAEIIKMFSNNFAVVRIAYANLFYDLSEKVKADYNLIHDTFMKVQHKDQSYMSVPGHDGTRGFGGKCLPKDLDFLIDTLQKEDISTDWLTTIRDLNKEWQKKF